MASPEMEHYLDFSAIVRLTAALPTLRRPGKKWTIAPAAL